MTKCNILIETYPQLGSLDVDFNNAEPESIKRVDHCNSSDRKWLSSHLHWATRNSRVVIITPLTPLPESF
jgi:hypothetical protein